MTSAECLSITISSGFVGGPPDTSRIGLSSGAGFHANARGGAWPLVLSPLPWRSTITPNPETLTSADFTPSTERTVSTSPASMRSRCWLPWVSLKAAFPRTWAARPLFTFTTRLLKVRVIVSDSTSVPHMNATPSTIATEVSRIRSFLAAMLLSVTFHICRSSQAGGRPRTS